MIIIYLLSYSFLISPFHSRVIYSGSSFSSRKNSSENLFWNPAGMTEKGYISSVHSIYGVSYSCAGAVFERGDLFLGTGLEYMNSGSMTETDATGESISEFSYYSLVPVVSGSYSMDKISAGIKLYMPYSRVDVYDSYGAGIDAGFIYSFSEEIAFSLFARNMGVQLKEYVDETEAFPFEFRIGAQYSPGPLEVSMEYSIPNGFFSSLEYPLSDIFSMALGYNSNISGFGEAGSSDFLSGFSAGIHLIYKNIILDIGAVSYGPVGISKTIGIGYGG